MDNNKPLRKQDLIWREIDGEIVIISTDNKKIHMLNDVGSKIWMLIDGSQDINTITSIIAEEFGETEDVVRKDIIEHMKTLKELNLLEE